MLAFLFSAIYSSLFFFFLKTGTARPFIVPRNDRQLSFPTWSFGKCRRETSCLLLQRKRASHFQCWYCVISPEHEYPILGGFCSSRLTELRKTILFGTGYHQSSSSRRHFCKRLFIDGILKPPLWRTWFDLVDVLT